MQLCDAIAITLQFNSFLTIWKMLASLCGVWWLVFALVLVLFVAPFVLFFFLVLPAYPSLTSHRGLLSFIDCNDGLKCILAFYWADGLFGLLFLGFCVCFCFCGLWPFVFALRVSDFNPVCIAIHS